MRCGVSKNIDIAQYIDVYIASDQGIEGGFTQFILHSLKKILSTSIGMNLTQYTQARMLSRLLENYKSISQGMSLINFKKNIFD